jgi:outer membrane receptor protein involved in Fe transport
MRFATLLVLVLAWAYCPGGESAARAQSANLQGIVVDGETGEPLPNANVVVVSVSDPASRAGTSTDLQGRFALEAMPGPSILTISFIGFATHSDTLSIPASLTVRLEPRDFDFNPITITASRRPERKLNAPARVTVIGAEQIAANGAVLTIADHLAETPSVDVVKTGLNQSRVVVRGFNDNLSSSLLAPAVRLTALQLLPTISSDIAQMEVVSGPASALYGPNAANGVIHVLTKSPFDSPGTSVQLSGGQQSLRSGGVRHAAVLSSRVAYKITTQYYSGQDFEYQSPAEMEARLSAVANGNDPGRIGQRDFGVKNFSATGRLETRLGPSSNPSRVTLTLDGGTTRGNNIETTPTGAAQVAGASLSYGQLRMTSGDLFVQAYGNFLNSGDSYFLRTGESFIDKSRMYVIQAQHGADLGTRTRLTYGADWFRTVPSNEGTVSGAYEDIDTMTEPGVYLQTDTDLSIKWALTLAGRVDYHDKLESAFFSPRAAVVFKPRSQHNFRATYNRAFKSPASNQLFGDILGVRDIFGLGGLGSEFGVSGATDLRAQGMITGFTFPRGASGLPQYTSPFASDPNRRFDLNDPTMTAVMWDVARFATVSGLAENLVAQGFLTPDAVEAVSAALELVLPTTVPAVLNQLKVLDLQSQQFFPVSDVSDQEPLGITRTETVELGYQGLVGRGTVVAIDGYWSRVRDFVGPLFVGTPNVFLEAGTLNAALLNALPALLEANPQAAAALLALDEAPLFGGRNGTAAEEIATIVSTGVAGAIPFGTVTPTEGFDPGAIVLMRRNFGDISLLGLDVSVMQYLSASLQVGGSVALVSDDQFRSDGGVVALNAPARKFAGFVRYSRGAWSGQGRVRGASGFPVRSDVYLGTTSAYSVVDLAIAYRVRAGSRVSLSVQNVLDRRHREFVDVAEIGRLGVLRLEVGI